MKTPFFLSIAALCLVAAACDRADEPARKKLLTQSVALELAVDLANERCARLYDDTPFKKDTFPISYDEGRWSWGRFDIMGVDGYSATVSFDSLGRDQRVEVFFSTDEVWPAR